MKKIFLNTVQCLHFVMLDIPALDVIQQYDMDFEKKKNDSSFLNKYVDGVKDFIKWYSDIVKKF